MAALKFKGETLNIRVTHNVLSEFISLRRTDFTEVMAILRNDPIGWTRDILYCSLLVYNPDVLGDMTKYEVGDEMCEMNQDDLTVFTGELLKDFATATKSNTKKAVTKKK